MNLQSGIVFVRQPNEPDLIEVNGYRDRPNQIPNQQDTKFPTASFGKVFVAVGILQLVERGSFHLDSTIGELLSFDLHDIDPDVTVRQLLTHSSGIPDYCDESKFPNYADVWQSYPKYKVRAF